MSVTKKHDAPPERLEKSRNGVRLLFEMVRMNPDIPMVDWVSAMMCFMAGQFHNSGWTYGQFKEDMEEAVKCYKRLWEETPEHLRILAQTAETNNEKTP